MESDRVDQNSYEATTARLDPALYQRIPPEELQEEQRTFADRPDFSEQDKALFSGIFRGTLIVAAVILLLVVMASEQAVAVLNVRVLIALVLLVLVVIGCLLAKWLPRIVPSASKEK